VSRAVFIAGSPSPTSRSSFLASRTRSILQQAGIEARSFSLRDFEPADVLHARMDAPAVVELVAAVKSTSAIVLSSPVYKATYSGALKVIVDLLPPDALVGKAALGIATTKLAAHGVYVSTAYAALFGFFRAQALETLVLLDDDLKADGPSFAASAAAVGRIEAAARSIVKAVAGA
jgi:FMN reductase